MIKCSFPKQNLVALILHLLQFQLNVVLIICVIQISTRDLSSNKNYIYIKVTLGNSDDTINLPTPGDSVMCVSLE